ncbi:hypothetical protein BU24DRAFT_462376 [Aaosphaeria arxii CBS 175.79]|uniref:Altered inheritance of mitochondria protein 6 n=1 Tax=Aaosphaeria arxii CBS 175.79 TaxID=1450172 RepID=A0A6A5XSM9_9PLEO|nr:uncharacterized protein BU24DRAFT_462376 [Aaosphaeria arxii CBS 175.79]KAF2016192.1 hypothetical protein BU24DRAFT_462376 [Aaosphaeria arxii CBS 175.79]
MEDTKQQQPPQQRIILDRSISSTSTIVTLSPLSEKEKESCIVVETQISSVDSDEELDAQGTPKSRHPRLQKLAGFAKLKSLWTPSSTDEESQTNSRRFIITRRWLIILAALISFGIIAGLTYVAFVASLIRRLNPPQPSNGLQRILKDWKEPTAEGAYTFDWMDDFSRDIVPKNCHSHNDYWRSVPLYEALAAGCSSVEADVWLTEDSDFLVSHTRKQAAKERTLNSLFLDPITNIFNQRNVSVASTEDKEVGMFDVDPNVTTTLLIDMKADGQKAFPVLLEKLRPLHEKGWLTYFDGTKVVRGPLTIVGSGRTPFDLVKAMDNDRFVFFDAPLSDIANPEYTTENSYYASTKLYNAIGRIWFNVLAPNQVETLKTQIKAAADKGLVSRYWDLPAWPISLRDKVWFTLTANSVGVLNVDDLVSATRWNWNWCIVAGIRLCGNS